MPTCRTFEISAEITLRPNDVPLVVLRRRGQTKVSIEYSFHQGDEGGPGVLADADAIAFCGLVDGHPYDDGPAFLERLHELVGQASGAVHRRGDMLSFVVDILTCQLDRLPSDTAEAR